LLDAASRSRRPKGGEEGVVLSPVEEEWANALAAQPIEIEFFVVVLECEVSPDDQVISAINSDTDRPTAQVPTFWANV
jgi:hypothetical protein